MVQLNAEQKELFVFKYPSQEQAYIQLIHQIRCPKCENQSIADSNAGISEDLRHIIYEKINQNKNEEEIKQFLVERYGEIILYDPKKSGANLLVWLGPILLLMIVILFIFLRQKRVMQQYNTNTPVINEEEKKKLDALLNKEKEQ